MALTNMKLTAEEAKNDMPSVPSSDGAPRYPYGLSLHLDDTALAKLGITTLPDVDTTMMLSAKVVVINTSQHQDEDGKHVSLGLQITDMELQPQGPDAATVFYTNG